MDWFSFWIGVGSMFAAQMAVCAAVVICAYRSAREPEIGEIIFPAKF